jgi:hypothetical protein
MAEPRDPCAAHALWGATFPTPSADGTRVDVVCTGGRPRVVPPAQWQAEEDRRDAATRGRTTLPHASRTTPHGS